MPIDCRDGLGLAWWNQFPHEFTRQDSEIAETCLQAERSLFRFIQLAWHVVEPASPLVNNWHLNAVCDHLQAVSAGEIRNLLINIPPRHMKSLAVCVFWPAWEWIIRPHARFLFSAYAMGLSERDSVKCRRLIESPWYQRHFSHRYQLCGDQNTKLRYDNNHCGHRIATSVGGSATGEGGDRIVVDDPHNVIDRESHAKRVETLTWWDETMSTRLNDPKTGAKVIVMQRIHEKDLSGHVLQQGGYEHLFLPAEFEPARKCVTKIGRPDPRTIEGELLWKTRMGEKEIADFKIRLGAEGYAGQFQQRPAPAGGALFRKEWFRYYRWIDSAGAAPNAAAPATDFPKPSQPAAPASQTSAPDAAYVLLHPDGSQKQVDASRCNRFAMMDPAGTEAGESARACFTVIQVWDVTREGDMLLVHQYRRQVQAADAARAAARICRDYDAAYIAIEKDGMGLGVVQQVKAAGITVRPIKARGSKEARSQTAEIRMANGQIYFPLGAAFLFDLEKELLEFPRSEYADQVDALSHAAMQVQKTARYATQEPARWEQEAVAAAEETWDE